LKITADTNLLVRAALNDDPTQTQLARKLLAEATLIAVPVAVFCELAWVLGAGGRYTGPQIGQAIENLLLSATVFTDRPAVEAGLALLALGGDFADGAIAHQGRSLGGTSFASFDNKAVKVLNTLGHAAFCPAA